MDSIEWNVCECLQNTVFWSHPLGAVNRAAGEKMLSIDSAAFGILVGSKEAVDVVLR